MKEVTVADDRKVNILAFFQVVASSQISPHLLFRAAKIVKNPDIQPDLLTNVADR
ncbi:MAG: hypothetical protein J5990_00935 [Bacteroidales bacterium]|nr:hypothetical protein [Bacteroidales bacterium]